MMFIESGNWRLNHRPDTQSSLKKSAVGGEADYSFRFFFDEIRNGTGGRYTKELDLYLNGNLVSSICVRVVPQEILWGLNDIMMEITGNSECWEEM